MNNLIVLLIVVLGTGLLMPGVMGQMEHKNPARGVQNGASYAISDIESINTTNGNLVLNIPLATLPRGRAEIGQSISLRYNSKLYDTSVETLPDFSGVPMDQNMLVHSPDGGWKFVTNTYILDVTSRFETMGSVPCDGSSYAVQNIYVWKVAMLMPDGSRKEFRPTGYVDGYMDDGFFEINPNGYRTNGCNGPPTLQTSGGMTYYSTDGSYTRLVVSHVPGSQHTGELNAWTMSMPDGSRVTGGGAGPVRLYDRNGNYIEGTTDIFQRSIAIQYEAGQDEDHVTMRGVGDTELKWIVKWKNITVSKNYTTTGANSGRGRGGTSSQMVNQLFRVVDKITLPSAAGSLFYEFDYNSEPGGANGWGEISKITMPSGATAEYEYTTPLPIDTGRVLRNYVSKKTLKWDLQYDGIVPPLRESEVTTYNVTPTSTTITNPDGSTTSESFGDTTFPNSASGIVFKTVNSSGNKVERTWAFNPPTGANPNANINAYVKTQYTTVADVNGNPSKTAIRDITLDPNGNQTQVLEYDWVDHGSINRDGNGLPTSIPAAAVLKRKTVSTFNNSATGNPNSAYWMASAPNVRNALASAEVQDAGGTPASRTEFTYDNAATTANVTETKSWDSWKDGVSRPLNSPHPVTGSKLDSLNSISTSVTYNSFGMPMTRTDANGVINTFTYGYINGHSNLYATQTVIASNHAAVKRTTNLGYDFYTGLVMSTTDVENSNATTTTAYDNLGRPTTLTNPLGAKTVTTYDDAQRIVVVKSDVEAVGDGRSVAVKFFDQLGRVRLSKTLENTLTEVATDETSGIKVQTRYLSTGGFNYTLTSNPYRATYPSGESSSTMGWTRTKVAGHGRQSQTETISGSTLPAPWGSNNASTGIVTTDLDAHRTLVTDQAQKKRMSATNGLGQLTDVWEIKDWDAETEMVTLPNGSMAYSYKTSYGYDPLNNLTGVTQGPASMNRTFLYSSLSRLRRATNPESGQITYSYDSNGNLKTKADTRPVTITYNYDALNRVTQRTYSDTTPPVTYTYDQHTNSKGQLTKVQNLVSTTEYTAFDILGRVTAHKQTTDGTAYTTGYDYYLNGTLKEQTYPSMRVVRNNVNPSGDIAMVQSKKNPAPEGFFVSYAYSMKYTAAGALTSMRLGNGNWESMTFNSRLQAEQIALGSGQNGSDLLKLDYTYGGTENNGNVRTQTITAPVLTQPLHQTYNYDALNRLGSVYETNNGAWMWWQYFGYDRFGNREITWGVGAADLSFEGNKIATHSYDAAGNTTNDGRPCGITYDAENKQTTITEWYSGYINRYWYDGEGRRVKKEVQSTGETTVFVYDAMGKLSAEYSTILAPVQQTSYLTADHLGSPRINTDQNGSVTSRHDYLPFGEEITAQMSYLRNYYGGDSVRQKFTGYERDNESGLDFAQARVFSSSIGRFLSGDSVLNDSEVADPMSWNLYAYVRNNPLKFVDPTGEQILVKLNDEESLEYYNGLLYSGRFNKGRFVRGAVYDGDNKFANKVLGYLNELRKDDVLSSRLTALQKSSRTHTIQIVTDPQATRVDPQSPDRADSGFPTGSLVSFNADKPALGSVTSHEKEPISPIALLAHELLGHSYDLDRGTGIRVDSSRSPGAFVKDPLSPAGEGFIQYNEISAVNVENRARARLGLPRRTYYGGFPLPRNLPRTRPRLFIGN